MTPKPPPEEPELKERVIHTRVPESLEAELRKRAQDLGMSVSNLVRNVLGHAFGLVGDVVADSHAIARAVSARDAAVNARDAAAGARAAKHAERSATGSLDDVLAWQPMVLAKNAVCARCNELLPKGTGAAIGVAEHGGARVIVCSPCFEEVRR